MSDGPTVTDEERISPADAFALVGNDLRVSILEALGQATEGSNAYSLSFEEIREQCGVRDSGRFNYHLQQLVGTFVRETDDGYDLRYPGVLLYQAIEADVFTAQVTVDPFPVDATCTECDGELLASYRNNLFLVRCSDCEHTELKYTLPPGVVRSEDRERVLRGANVFARRDVMAVANHVCPTCGDRMFHEIVPEDEKSPGLESGIRGPAVVHHCRGCSQFLCSTVTMPLLYRPAVVAFFQDHGVDVLSAYLWELDAGSSDAVAVTGDDPIRAEVTFVAGDERLRLAIDEDLEIHDAERE